MSPNTKISICTTRETSSSFSTRAPFGSKRNARNNHFGDKQSCHTDGRQIASCVPTLPISKWNINEFRTLEIEIVSSFLLYYIHIGERFYFHKMRFFYLSYSSLRYLKYIFFLFDQKMLC
jgi:hypothetical protein